jgi:hypothetical protein
LQQRIMDCRVKPGNDDAESSSAIAAGIIPRPRRRIGVGRILEIRFVPWPDAE